MRKIAVVLLLGFVWFGCSEEPDDTEIPDAGMDTGPVDDVDPGDDVDDPVLDHNPCGGDDDLDYEGHQAAPGDRCGECGDGVLVCDGPDELICFGADGENACGGCEPLIAEPDTSCGPCGQGSWTCQPDGTVECEGQQDRNGCGGCDQLDDAPGTSCQLDDNYTGIHRCTGPDEVSCVEPGLNACGGTSSLDAQPGTSCGECNLGVVVCDGTDAVECLDEDRGANGCGGCGPLAGEPGEACGQCDGEWFCPGDDFVACDEPDKNACGGCTDFGDASPGDTCGHGILVCDGTDELTCSEEASNPCGGTSALDAQPGDVCGECGDGQYICASPNDVVCQGASETNACGGCGLLPGEHGDDCGVDGVWQCTDNGAMRCESDDQTNACGGTGTLARQPGEACGPCGLDVVICTDSEQVACSGQTPCPAFVGDDVAITDVTETSARFEGELTQLPDIGIDEYGFCWAAGADPTGDLDNCQSVNEPADAGSFSMNVDELEPGTEYTVRAYAIPDTEPLYSNPSTFWTTPPAPQNVEASDNLDNRVSISWNASTGAEQYEIVRDPGTENEEVVGAAVVTTVDDFGADDAPPPEAPEISSITDGDRTDGVEIEWDPAETEPGTLHDYEVVAVNPDGLESQPGHTQGQKAAAEVTDYELCIDGAEDCDDDETWSELSVSGDELRHLDGSAPLGEILKGDVTASEGDHTDFVRLTATDWAVDPPEQRLYQLRAVNDAGAGEPSDAEDGWGRRDVGSLHYQWYGSIGDDDFTPLYGPATDGDTYDDHDAPDDGTPRDYYVEVSADGAGSLEAPDEPVSGHVAIATDLLTLDADNVQGTSATLHGLFNGQGSTETTDLGFCWHIDQPAEDGTCETTGDVVDEGEEFSMEISGLDGATDYFVRSFAIDENGEHSHANHRSFTTQRTQPTGIFASQGEHEEHVVVEWDPGADDTDSYRVYRDDDPEPIADVDHTGEETYRIEDGDAEPGAAPEEPIHLTIEESTDALRLDWDGAIAADGTEHTYEVVAVIDDEEIESSPPATGWRDSRGVDGYEIRSSIDPDDPDSWSDWKEVDGPDDREYHDYSAPAGNITDFGPGGTTATDAAHTDYVELETPQADTEPGTEKFYEVRAFNETDGGDTAGVSGQRQIGEDVTYDWEYSTDGTDYEPVPGCSDSRLCQDTDAPADGTERHYQVVMSAVGTDDEIVDAGSGRRAVQALVETLNPLDFSHEDIETDRAVLYADVTELGAPNPDDYGFCYSDYEPWPDHDNADCIGFGNLSSGGQFSELIAQFEPGTSYRVRAFVHTDAEGQRDDGTPVGYDYGATETFTTRPVAPQLTTESHRDHVTISWNDADADLQYRVIRDPDTDYEEVVGTVSDISVTDEGAEPGTVEKVDGLVAEDGIASIALSWDPAETGPGPEHDYTAVAINADGLESSRADIESGRRAAADIDSYEVTHEETEQWFDAGRDCGGGECSWEYFHAPDGNIIYDCDIYASEGEYVEHVELISGDGDTGELCEAVAEDGPSLDYRVRAVNEVEVRGEASEPDSALREAGDLNYEWQRDDAPFASIDNDCVDELECTDISAPDDGIARDYRMVVSADGVEEPTISAHDEGYVAVLQLAFAGIPPIESTAGEPLGIAVELLNQDNERMHLEGYGIAVETDRHSFDNWTTTASTNTDTEGVAEFDDLTIETAAADYGLTATPRDTTHFQDNADDTATLDVVASNVSSQTSSIRGIDGAVDDGEDQAEVTIELRDEYGNPVAGVTPQFETNTPTYDTYEACTATDDDGISTCAMSTTLAGEKTLEITDPVQTTGETVEFLHGCDDENDGPFGGGTGTGDDPHRICEPAHLATIGDEDVLDDSFVLTADIDMAGVGDFTVIGDEPSPFTGKFDGQGHHIENLEIDASTQDFVGVFGAVGDDGVIDSMKVHHLDVAGNDNVGGLVGHNNGTIVDSRTGGEVDGDDNVGGLAGVHDGTIVDSAADVDVNGATGVGGLVGSHDTGDIDTSFSTGSVDATEEVGGLVGIVGNSGSITESHTVAEIEATDRVGGLVGFNDGGIIDNSYAAVQMTATGSDIGGLAGENTGSVTASYWDQTTSGIDDNDDDGGAGQPLESNDFEVESSFDNWDFDTTWRIGRAGDGHLRPVVDGQIEWNCDPTDSPFGGGDGSTESPYLLCSTNHLVNLAAGTDYLNDDFLVADDIDMKYIDDFEMIGDVEVVDDELHTEPYTGQFDGNDRTIENLTLHRPAAGHVALFRHVGPSAQVSDITLKNVEITGGTDESGLDDPNGDDDEDVNPELVPGYTAALAALNEGTLSGIEVSGAITGSIYVGAVSGLDEGSVTDAHVEAHIEGSELIGGVAGQVFQTSITDSHVEATISGLRNIGGIAGINDVSTVDTSFAEVDIEGEPNLQGDANVGGLVGLNVSGTVTNSEAHGRIRGHANVGGIGGAHFDSTIDNTSADIDVAGHRNVGGLNGFHNQSCSTQNSNVDGTVRGYEQIGGLIGLNEGDVAVSYATAEVIGGLRTGGLVGLNDINGDIDRAYSHGLVEGHDAVGGLTGENHGEITASYSTAAVTGEVHVGGLVGLSDEWSHIDRTYATGSVDGISGVGGLVGEARTDDDTVAASYWDSATTGLLESDGGTALNTGDFDDENNFDGWNFTTIWMMGTAPDGNHRPVLQWQ